MPMVRIESDLHIKMKALAASDGRSLTQYVHRVLSAHYASELWAADDPNGSPPSTPIRRSATERRKTGVLSHDRAQAQAVHDEMVALANLRPPRRRGSQ